MTTEPLTSRACVVCGKIFPVGFERSPGRRDMLDFHCQKPTLACPTFDPEPETNEQGGRTAQEIRQRLYEDWFTGRTTPRAPQPEVAFRPAPEPAKTPFQDVGDWWSR